VLDWGRGMGEKGMTFPFFSFIAGLIDNKVDSLINRDLNQDDRLAAVAAAETDLLGPLHEVNYTTMQG